MADICIWFGIFLAGLICGLAVPPNRPVERCPDLDDEGVGEQCGLRAGHKGKCRVTYDEPYLQG